MFDVKSRSHAFVDDAPRDGGTDTAFAEQFAVVAPPARAGHVAQLAGARYGAGRGVNLPAVALVVAIHAVIIFALVQVRSHFVRKQETAMAVVNLSPPAPPPPAADTPPPPPPQVVAPKPIVQTPVPAPVIATTPIPMPVTPQPVAVTAPAPPVPVAAAPSVVRASDLGTRMVAGKPPRYPIESRRKHEQGTVVLALTLGVDGRVESINVSRSSGFARLDDAARDAVKGWRWEPTMVNGTPARVMGVVEIPFVLKG